ncbi:MAG: response regulator [Candidatus Liptonbacteria bacterium]|nr:response regulator [Candidatus Liptonbacteria bacterium]
MMDIPKTILAVRITPKTVEVVEDEKTVLKAISEKLELEGFSVLTAEDGETGLITALGKKPDLILLDLIMPKMTGLQMMRQLREANEYGKRVPIIILTNLSANEPMSAVLAKDEPSFYLVKADWKLEDVISKIRETLERLPAKE